MFICCICLHHLIGSCCVPFSTMSSKRAPPYLPGCHVFLAPIYHKQKRIMSLVVRRCKSAPPPDCNLSAIRCSRPRSPLYVQYHARSISAPPTVCQ